MKKKIKKYGFTKMQKTVTILTLNNLHYRKHIQKDKIDYLYTKLLALKENTRQQDQRPIAD